MSIDEGGFQLACGGHVTPPTTNLVLMMMTMMIWRRKRGFLKSDACHPAHHQLGINDDDDDDDNDTEEEKGIFEK